MKIMSTSTLQINPDACFAWSDPLMPRIWYPCRNQLHRHQNYLPSHFGRILAREPINQKMLVANWPHTTKVAEGISSRRQSRQDDTSSSF